MTEDRLSGLFDEIRNESAQTPISEVDQWIDAAVVAGATVGILATLKLVLIKKPLIMWTTLLTVTSGASLGLVLLFSKPEIKEQPVKKEPVSYAAPAKFIPEDKEEAPAEQESPKLAEPIGKKQQGSNDQPEDLEVLVPLKLPIIERILGISMHRMQTNESFTKVHVSGALYVELSQGKSCSVHIEPETAKDLVEVEILDGTLYLKNAFNVKNKQGKVVVKVCVEDLKELYLSGATSLTTVNQLGLDVLNLEMDGASNASLDMKVRILKADFSGASQVEIAGGCEMAKLDVSGASHAKLSGFEVQKVILDNTGASEVELFISEELNVDASGASVTSYKSVSGSTVKVDANTSGSAIVKNTK